MLNIGMAELLLFGIIALLVLGPEKLPQAARFAGKSYAKVKRLISNVQNDIDRELRLSELREQMQQEMKKIQELEAKMQLQMQTLEQQKITLIEPEVPILAQQSQATAYIPCEKPMLNAPIQSKKQDHRVYKVAV